MCLSQPARVVELRPDALVVDLDGRRRLVTNLLAPEARVGDDVLVGMGNVLAVLPRDDAARLRELITTLTPSPDSP
jgi:hydrogenase maturation factor